MALGDSRTSSVNNTWPDSLAANLRLPSDLVWGMSDGGVGGQTTQQAASTINSMIAGLSPQQPVVNILLNWGANDMGGLPAEATWEGYYYTILDALHAQWPNAKCYIMRPWKRGFDADAATLHGWIDTIVAARSTFAAVGPDEAVWLKGSDNGATNTTDGQHYSAAGEIACASVWQTTLGY